LKCFPDKILFVIRNSLLDIRYSMVRYSQGTGIIFHVISYKREKNRFAMRLTGFLLLLALSACAGARLSLEERVVGHWQMERIVQDGTNDVSAQQNPMNNRYIHFYENGTFESGGDPYGKNTGKWTLDPDSHELYIDSDSGEDDDSYWIVSIDEDRMHWQGTHFDFNKRFAIDFRRHVD